MEKKTANEIMTGAKKLMDTLDKIISICQDDMEMNDPDRVRMLKTIGRVNSEIYDEIMHPIAKEFPDLARKLFPNAPFSLDD